MPKTAPPGRIAPIFLSLWCAASGLIGAEENLPIDRAGLGTRAERSSGRSGVTCFISLEQLNGAVRGGSKDGLLIDFTAVKQLLDGTALDSSKLYGRVSAGPYPFESKETRFSYRRFRQRDSITKGKGTLKVGELLGGRVNSEGWTDRGQVGLRFELSLEAAGQDRNLGMYDTVVRFRKTKDGMFEREPAVFEGPFVNLITSDEPSAAVITFVTDVKARARVVLSEPGGTERVVWGGDPVRRHEIRLAELKPDTIYLYRVVVGSSSTKTFQFKTAPGRGKGRVTFGFFGDTRAGYGGGLNSYMGVNLKTLTRLAQMAYHANAEFLLVGGDLVNGYTTVPDDFRAQLYAWKTGVAGFWNERPIFAAMGNHEALTRSFEEAGKDYTFDRWPYATESAEAVFAEVFAHPENGPTPSDPRRPAYKENVYSLQYGKVKVIAFNNNYWVSYASSEYGGAPEGYLLDDQLDWIVRELQKAENDPTVWYVLLFAQEPVFPNGGHVADGMWHSGDNRTRAHTFRDGRLLPHEDGMLSVRNKFARAVARSSKVAAVLGADEHAYHRVFIDRTVPVGDIDRDDRNKNGKIDQVAGESCSPLADLEHGTWYIVSGGGGAPYYAEESAPWNDYWTAKDRQRLPSGVTGFRYSSQENLILIDVDEERIGMRVLSIHGEVIDEVPNLMADRSR